jgi:hypothetical protein
MAGRSVDFGQRVSTVCSCRAVAGDMDYAVAADSLSTRSSARWKGTRRPGGDVNRAGRTNCSPWCRLFVEELTGTPAVDMGEVVRVLKAIERLSRSSTGGAQRFAGRLTGRTRSSS